MTNYWYPKPPYEKEQPIWMNFYVAEYSLKNSERTIDSIVQRQFHTIQLPLPRDVGYQANHEYGMGFSPLVPNSVYSSNIANNGGLNQQSAIQAREYSRAGFLNEYSDAQSTFRRFSNITELTLYSEARKKYIFEYLFAPKNKEESEEVENIVGTFRKTSYPVAVTGLPERTYPQNLWALKVSGPDDNIDYSGDFMGRPLVCVLKTVSVKKNDKSDPVIRLLPSGYSNITLLGLVFEEFETGTYDPEENEVFSKSEISAKYFGNTP
jgi:hypothetical protein